MPKTIDEYKWEFVEQHSKDFLDAKLNGKEAERSLVEMMNDYSLQRLNDDIQREQNVKKSILDKNIKDIYFGDLEGLL